MGIMDKFKRRTLVDVAAELEDELANVEQWETEVEKLASELAHSREMLAEAQKKFETKRAELFAQHPALAPSVNDLANGTGHVVGLGSQRPVLPGDVIEVDDDTPPDPNGTLGVGQSRLPADSFDDEERIDFDER